TPTFRLGDLAESPGHPAPGSRASVDRVAQRLARFEGDGVAGLDLDRLTGLRVFPGAGATVALHEGTEADQGDAVLTVQRAGDLFEHGIENTIGLILGQ